MQVNRIVDRKLSETWISFLPPGTRLDGRSSGALDECTFHQVTVVFARHFSCCLLAVIGVYSQSNSDLGPGCVPFLFSVVPVLDECISAKALTD